MINRTRHSWLIKISVSALLVLGAAELHAQQDRFNWRFGVGVGNQYAFGNPYNEDSLSSNSMVEFDPAFFSYSASLELSLSQSFSLRVFTQTRPQDYTITNSGLVLSYYFDNDYLFGKRAFISPYLSIGAGYGENQNSFNVPFGGGLKFRISSRVNINIDYSARSYTERWGESNFDFGNELGGYSSISVHYNFGKKPRSYNAPKPYVSPYAKPQQSAQASLPSAPMVVEKEIEITKNVADTPKTTTAVGETMDTTADVVIDKTVFQSAPTDSTSRAEFIERYGNILKAPRLRDSARSVNFEMALVGDTTAASINSSAQMPIRSKTQNYPNRDSALAELQFEIQQQKLKNELSLLRKAENDSSINAILKENEMLRSQVNANNQYTNLSQRISQLESRPDQIGTEAGTSQSNTYTPTSTSGTTSTYTGSNYQPAAANQGAGSVVGGTAVVLHKVIR